MNKIMYVELSNGRCGLSTDSKAEIMKQVGTDNLRSISVATKKQIDFVRAMGGYVPVDGKIPKG